MPLLQMFDDVELHVVFKYQNETSHKHNNEERELER